MTENQVISFAQFLKETSGDGFLYQPECEEYLNDSETADWIKVDDYIAPIAAEVITTAAEVDRELYASIMTVIKSAYKQLKKREETETVYEIDMNGDPVDVKNQLDNFWSEIYTGKEIKDLRSDANGVIFYRSESK